MSQNVDLAAYHVGKIPLTSKSPKYATSPLCLLIFDDFLRAIFANTHLVFAEKSYPPSAARAFAARLGAGGARAPGEHGEGLDARSRVAVELRIIPCFSVCGTVGPHGPPPPRTPCSYGPIPMVSLKRVALPARHSACASVRCIYDNLRL